MYFKINLISINLILLFDINFAQNDEIVLNTSSGSVRGLTIQVLDKNVNQFLGIPFAEPPVGSLRFAKPKPIEKPIEGIIDATKQKYSCIQPMKPELEFYLGKVSISEDCLTLNIWSANDNYTALKPVMFWIYGGALAIGSIFQPMYNGSVLATQDVVFVSTNYRLGHFGFLFGDDESAPGNVGLFDQRLALEWVRENIHLFGGDKNQITIFGESAGSWSVSAHILSPLSKGLFQRAIMQSGAHMYNKDRPIISKDEALLKAKGLAKQLNCSDDKQWLECLRTVEPELLIVKGKPFYPVDGTEFLPLSAQNAFIDGTYNKDLDFMAGINKDEGSYLSWALNREIPYKTLTKEDFYKFVNITEEDYHNIDIESVVSFYLNNTDLEDSDAIKWKISDYFGDLVIKCPTYLFAKRYAEHSSTESNVFFYELTHTARGEEAEEQMGIFHAAEIDFVFGLILLEQDTNTEEDIKFSKEVLRLWTDFAKFGKPDNNWPKFIDTESHRIETKIKDLNPKNSDKYFDHLFDESCDGFWKQYFL